MNQNILKISCFLLILAVIGGSCKKDDFFYAENGTKNKFQIQKNTVIVKCHSNAAAIALSEQSIFKSVAMVSDIWIIATINPRKITIHDIERNQQNVVSATHGLKYKDGTMQYPTDTIFVQLKNNTSTQDIVNIIDVEKVNSVQLFNPYSMIYKIGLNVSLSEILPICRKLYESGLCEFAEPNFFRESKK
ncbi:MAG: hypothetical protein LBU90_03115 [Bacteroidales bacterium]|jgi:hypothetical protein|nr:hypothetical protein [Bacteroidales bacterium]